MYYAATTIDPVGRKPSTQRAIEHTRTFTTQGQLNNELKTDSPRPRSLSTVKGSIMGYIKSTPKRTGSESEYFTSVTRLKLLTTIHQGSTVTTTSEDSLSHQSTPSAEPFADAALKDRNILSRTKSDFNNRISTTTQTWAILQHRNQSTESITDNLSNYPPAEVTQVPDNSNNTHNEYDSTETMEIEKHDVSQRKNLQPTVNCTSTPCSPFLLTFLKISCGCRKNIMDIKLQTFSVLSTESSTVSLSPPTALNTFTISSLLTKGKTTLFPPNKYTGTNEVPERPHTSESVWSILTRRTTTSSKENSVQTGTETQETVIPETKQRRILHDLVPKIPDYSYDPVMILAASFIGLLIVCLIICFLFR